MSILLRYLGREILGSMLLALVSLLLLFVFIDFIQEIPDLRPASGYTLPVILVRILLGIPSHVQELMPAATIVGALFAFARLSSASEFTVMRASGLSVWRLSGYMVGLGLLLAVLSFVLGEFVIPHSERASQQLKLRATSGVVAQQFRSGLWAKDGQSFINVRELLPDTSLVDMRVYEFDHDFHLRTIRHAQRGVWQPDGSWRLEEVVQTHISLSGTVIEHLPVLSWRSDVTPDLLAVLMIPPDRMSARALQTYVEHLRENRQRATRYEIALWNKLTFPLAAPVMLLLALPFAYYQPRSATVSGRVLAGILIGLGFHLLNRMVGHIGLLNDWPPSVSALSALVAFCLAAALALWRVERN